LAREIMEIILVGSMVCVSTPAPDAAGTDVLLVFTYERRRKIVELFRYQPSANPLPCLNCGEDIPSGSGKVVLVPLALKVVECVAKGRVKVSADGLPLLPIPVPILDGSSLEVAGHSAQGAGGEKVVAALACAGVTHRAGGEALPYPRVFHGWCIVHL
jgi:hypothetical protein